MQGQKQIQAEKLSSIVYFLTVVSISAAFQRDITATCGLLWYFSLAGSSILCSFSF